MLAGVAFLKEEHRTKAIGFGGHSFGGAVVIRAAVAASSIVSTIDYGDKRVPLLAAHFLYNIEKTRDKQTCKR